MYLLRKFLFMGWPWYRHLLAHKLVYKLKGYVPYIFLSSNLFVGWLLLVLSTHRNIYYLCKNCKGLIPQRWKVFDILHNLVHLLKFVQEFYYVATNIIWFDYVTLQYRFSNMLQVLWKIFEDQHELKLIHEWTWKCRLF